jgi:hypothetical protein
MKPPNIFKAWRANIAEGNIIYNLFLKVSTTCQVLTWKQPYQKCPANRSYIFQRAILEFNEGRLKQAC